ncbi:MULTISPECIES: heme ABC transporter ATP-binding protein [Sphingomonadaceae]|uniref:heme ABC transporter ATP-binding protein n=1 Tax=Sphingomonadales TaxID=204457 RepID=UPI000C20DFB4|nr:MULTISPECIES: heme ABC transporter ATP-binding protein [Sphingomonadaceae]PJG44943.1 heme ABC transporter ATP-binding protein [Sphingobium sp. LB126]PJG45077.1 heme ABC transporter ATP-binding protein [Sphingobium sp. LB126]
MTPTPAIQLRGLSVTLGCAPVLSDISLDLAYGTLTALVGPNGAGKSTLLSVIAGDVPPDEGSVAIEGHAVAAWCSRGLARRRAMFVQDHRINFAFRVREVVEMGRQPHPPDPIADERIVSGAMATADIAHLAMRDITSLSGGEGARTSFARVLAQDCPIVLLDEPTAALDLRHQESLLATARDLARAGACVVIVLHDLNLASGYADRIVILKNGAVAADGTPRDVLTSGTIEDVYDQSVLVLDHPTRRTPLVVTI